MQGRLPLFSSFFLLPSTSLHLPTLPLYIYTYIYTIHSSQPQSLNDNGNSTLLVSATTVEGMA
jgi:hypothetical protein